MFLTILSILAAVITIGGGIAATIRQLKKIAKRDDERYGKLPIPAVDDSTEADSVEVSLDSAEEVALGLVVTDPLAHSAGAWTYPLQQELRKRGLTGAEATVALTSLTSRGLLEAVERETIEYGSDRPSKAPAYRLIDGASEGHSRIRVWSDDPITREVFRSIGLQTGATVAHWREVRY